MLRTHAVTEHLIVVFLETFSSNSCFPQNFSRNQLAFEMQRSDHHVLQKALKAVTNRKNEPPKAKHLTTISRCVLRDSQFSDSALRQITHFLYPRLRSTSPELSLKAHFVVHHLFTDPAVDGWAVFNYIATCFSAPRRSSVDGTVGAAFSLKAIDDPHHSMNDPTIPRQHNIDTLESAKKTRNLKKPSLPHVRFRKRLIDDDYADGLAKPSDDTLQPFLPNLAHSIAQTTEENRLLSHYNRYLRERVLHFCRLKLDPFHERVKGTSVIDESDPNSPNYFSALVNQAQCILQQVRLLLNCTLSDRLMKDSLYSYCFGFLTNDLSILFHFLSVALVVALQNFMTLSRPNAEKTLFIYKEFTQLQLYTEVKLFISQGGIPVFDRKLDLPKALKQDRESIIKLTHSLEAYVYECDSNSDYSNSKTLGDSTEEDPSSEQKSYTTAFSSSAVDFHVSSSKASQPSSHSPHYSNFPTHGVDEHKKAPVHSTDQGEVDPYFTHPSHTSANSESKTRNQRLPTILDAQRQSDHTACLSYSSLQSTEQFHAPLQTIESIDSDKRYPTFLSDPASSSHSRTLDVVRENHSALENVPADFDMNDPSMENWERLFESLGNSDATFSLKFDLASALQNTIKLHEENRVMEEKKQAEKHLMKKTPSSQSLSDSFKTGMKGLPKLSSKLKLSSYSNLTSPNQTVARGGKDKSSSQKEKRIPSSETEASMAPSPIFSTDRQCSSESQYSWTTQYTSSSKEDNDTSPYDTYGRLQTGQIYPSKNSNTFHQNSLFYPIHDYNRYDKTPSPLNIK